MRQAVSPYRISPDVSADIRAAAIRVQDTFVPELAVLRVPYVVEVDAAKKNKDDLIKLEADLKSIPLAGGHTLYDWCNGFVAKGEHIGTLLSERADITSMSRREANKLRTVTIAMLGRFRGALADEMANNQNLARDLDSRIFAYVDQLAEMCAHAARSKKTPAAPSSPPAPTFP